MAKIKPYPWTCGECHEKAVHAAVVPELSGQAWITGFAEYVLDPDDPFPEGFTVGDIWA